MKPFAALFLIMMTLSACIKNEEKTPVTNNNVKQGIECDKYAPEINEILKEKTQEDGNDRNLNEVFYSPKNNKCYYSETTYAGKKEPNWQQAYKVLAYEYGISENLNEASCDFEYNETGWKEKVEWQCAQFNQLIEDLKAKN